MPQLLSTLFSRPRRCAGRLSAGGLLLCLVLSLQLSAGTRRYRATFGPDPATSINLAFELFDAAAVRVVYDVQDHGSRVEAYRQSAQPARQINHAGMRNVFVRLHNLRPATRYFFLVVDDRQVSRRMIVETPPADPNQPLSIIAGGDSRNNRQVAMAANRLVAKLRPHFVLFGGDMTGGDTAGEWQQWLDDWQLTTSSDGRLTPIVPARGNHERANSSIANLFDVPNPQVYYGLNFGGGLLRTYTLNTMAPPGGDQLRWLANDLRRTTTTWKIAQYHHAMRPHTATKSERDELVTLWASQFTSHGMNLVVESDAHTVKQTYPIRPSREAGSHENFIRDDARGTVYVGEGCWGAPLRANNDDKPWTRASGRFNQFKWIWVDQAQIQVRTVDINRSAGVVQDMPYDSRFRLLPGLQLWDAPNTGQVLRIQRRAAPAQTAPRFNDRQAVIRPSAPPVPSVLRRTASGRVRVSFRMPAAGKPEILVVGPGYRLLHQVQLQTRGPGPYTEEISLPALPQGAKMELVVKAGGKVVAKYDLQ